MAVAKKASLANYVPYYGEDEEARTPGEDDEDGVTDKNMFESEEEEVMEFIKHEQTKLRSAKAK